jgi:tetratricopeptide (TPR) repeat protein
MRQSVAIVAACAALLTAAIALTHARERLGPLPSPATGSATTYVRSPDALRRMALSYDALAADFYWIRAIQYYGGTKLSTDAQKTYEGLYPLLDLTTSLDPHFNIAYRFGAVFLGEPYPSGAGRPDQAIALLQKGLTAQPDRWEFAYDIGFVHYWWLQAYKEAAAWFLRAAELPRAPEWLKPLAAQVLAQGGNPESSRRIWQQVLDSAESEWERQLAASQLRQLDAR